jgi:hypothetical protein
MYIIRSMRVRPRARIALAACALAGACAGAFGREYEYEEELYLDIDGSASVVINSSIRALVTLRGLPIEPALHARFDAGETRRLFESLGCHVARVAQPWYRHGRRFIQVRLTTGDVTSLASCKALSWSTYRFSQSEGAVHFDQTVGQSATVPGPADSALAPQESAAGVWSGNELVAFRLHLPGKVRSHNVRMLADNATGHIERGNILTWEQRLADRRAGVPVVMQVTMDPESILYRTLWLFAGSFVAAVVVLAALIWWAMLKGRKRLRVGVPGLGAQGSRRP